MNEEKKRSFEENMVQKVIDPTTGRDITGIYIKDKLTHLEKIADDIIKTALSECKKNPENKIHIYEKFYWEIHEKLGMGSIGPATAAAGPLMQEKKEKLSNILDINDKDKIK